MDTVAKMFDSMVLRRLKLWGSVDQCQAGVREKRGCLEQILTIRTAISTALKKRCKLYIIYIDFRAAYDTVPRKKADRGAEEKRLRQNTNSGNPCYGASPLKGESRDRGVMAEGYLIQGEGVDFLGASTGEGPLPQNNSLAARRHPH